MKKNEFESSYNKQITTNILKSRRLDDCLKKTKCWVFLEEKKKRGKERPREELHIVAKCNCRPNGITITQQS
jgi:hypothetical protein